MAKIVLLVVSVVLLQIADAALQCYQCKGPECEKESKTWQKVTCGDTGAAPYTGHEWACLTLKYKDRVSYKDAVQRKCVSVEMKNGKPDFKCPTADGEPTSCPVCQKDLCNSAPRISFSIIAIFGVLLACLVPKLL